MDSDLVALFVDLAQQDRRGDAVARLARWAGAEEALLLVRDDELGGFLPASGLRQTLPGGRLWRDFIRSLSPGVVSADVDYPTREKTSRALAHVWADGVALVLIADGDLPAEGRERLANVLELMPTIAPALRSELTIRILRGELEVAQSAGQQANDLAQALDASRRELERALAEAARLNEELKDADRKKDDFLAMLGHELRNPMAAISGAIEVMRARPNDTERVARARAIIERQAAQLARLVDDLLDVARVTRGKIPLRLEAVSVEDIVHRAIDSVHPLIASKRHTVDVDVRTRSDVMADRTRLEQMVTNLLTNAAKYTNPGGRIVVRVDVEGEEVVIDVEDNGIGIAPEMLSKIFEPFLQIDPSVERSGGGLGVGLTVVTRLAALHHGSVEAQSTIGKGSIFSLRLPRASAPQASESAGPATAEKPRTKKRILIVDDNLDSAEMMVDLMCSWGHEAVHAADGPSAVARALEWGPDVVLLDIGLPGMDGYEVAAKLRTHEVTRESRIVAVSGYGLESDRMKSRAAGCDQHLVKPVDLRALAHALDG